MSKKEELKQTYMKDVELASSKQKFGYFSMPPSAFAGSTTFEQKKSNIFINDQFKGIKMENLKHNKGTFSQVYAQVVF